MRASACIAGAISLFFSPSLSFLLPFIFSRNSTRKLTLPSPLTTLLSETPFNYGITAIYGMD